MNIFLIILHFFMTLVCIKYIICHIYSMSMFGRIINTVLNIIANYDTL